MLNSKWFLEQTTGNEGSFHSIKEILYAGRSRYQRIDIIRTGSYGKCLILDGKMQSSEADEFIYHEAIVHPALFVSELPEKILIAGGGEGATAREALKHPTVSRVVVVDLDKEVVDICQKYLPEWHCGAFEDSRVDLHFDNAREFIENAGEFDIIILDLPEPNEGGPAFMLYTKEFYEIVFRRLKDNGILVTQAASTSVNNLKVFTSIMNTLKHVFPVVRPYMVNIPSFFAPWGFVLASKGNDPLSLQAKHIERKTDSLKGPLMFYDYETHLRIFSLPKYLRQAAAREDVIISDSSPLSFY